MPDKKTIARARKAKREEKAPTTQAGGFVHEEIGHIREGKLGAKNAKQAIAIGLSKARRAGVKLPAPKKGAGESTRKQVKRTTTKAKAKAKAKAPKRAPAGKQALERQPRAAATPRALSRQGRQAARRRKKTTTSPRSRTKRESSSSEK